MNITSIIQGRVHFYATCRRPSLGKFPYTIHMLPTKTYLFSVTLIWSPYVYFLFMFINTNTFLKPVFSHIGGLKTWTFDGN